MLTNNAIDFLSLGQRSITSLKRGQKDLDDFFSNEANLDRYINNIRLLATLRNIEIQDLSKKSGHHKFFISRLLRKESGVRKPRPNSISAIAKALGVDPKFLVESDIENLFRQAIEHKQSQ